MYLDAMSQTGFTDGGSDEEHTDERLAAVETLRIRWDDFKKALRNNWLTDTDRGRGGNTVLRLSPGRKGFRETMTAETYFSEQGVRYDSNWEQEPIHIRPHLILETGLDRGTRGLMEWPEQWHIENNFSEEEIEEMGGIEKALDEEREFWWGELRAQLPTEFDVSSSYPMKSKQVDIEWVFDEDEDEESE